MAGKIKSVFIDPPFITGEVGSERTLLVLCTAFRARADRYPNLTVKKIPKAVLARCEWKTCQKPCLQKVR